LRAFGGPGVQVFDRIDNAPSKLAEDWAGPGATVFLKCSPRKAEISGGVMSADVTRRDAGR
jgi:hypothetical protein